MEENENDNPYAPPSADVAQAIDECNRVENIDLPGSPLSGKGWYWLFFKPSYFFSNPGWLLKAPEILMVAWVSGIAYAIDQIDTRIVKTDFGSTNSTWESLEPWLMGSWTNLGIFVLGYGAFSALFIWLFAGWWYRVRLGWSGAKDVAPSHARAVYVYQDLVQSAPAAILVLLLPIWYADYADYWAAEEFVSSVVMLFVVWSCVTSYKAARTFPVRAWPARFWFLILPLSIYVIALGVLGAAYYWMFDSA